MPNRIRGYTLVEVLIGLMLFGFLFVGSYTAYKDFISRQALDRSIQDLKQATREAKQLALSGEKSSSCTNKTLVGYRVAFGGNCFNFPDCTYNQFSIREICNNGVSDTIKIIKTYSTGTVHYTFGSVSGITFKPIGQGTDLISDIQIPFTHTIYGSQRTVTITPAGVVQ